jgi:ribosomal protein S18 acetylase RimI-like enzyme
MNLILRKIIESDYPKVIDLFCTNIEEAKDYISHGEIQMGIALDRHTLAPDLRTTWKRYLTEQVSEDPDGVIVCLNGDEIVGFVVAEINKDLGHSFGVICDMITRKDVRDSGIGSLLMKAALSFFAEKGIKQIFLESGIENQSAHTFFEKHGFECTSKVFMLRNENLTSPSD